MFGIFVLQKRRRRKALEKFMRDLRALPGGEDFIRATRQKFIVQRVELLRNTKQLEEAKKIIFEWLEEDFAAWRTKHDPRDLNFIAETMRLAGMPKECCMMLEKVAANYPRKFCIDLTWLCTDMALVLHQQGRPVEEVISWFKRALREKPPVGATVIADDSIRARAAFCGFVASSASGHATDETDFLERLSQLEPSRDWTSGETIENFAKTFVGFLNSQERLEPPVPPASGKSAELGGPDSIDKEYVFHRVLLLPQNAVAQNRAAIKVTAEAWVKQDASGERNYGMRVFPGADAFSMYEARAAIYWKRQLDLRRITVGQAADWLRELEVKTKQRYLCTDPSKPDQITAVILFSGLACASLHFAIARFESLNAPEAIRSWYQGGLAMGQAFPRYRQIERATALKLAIEAVDGEFFSHLLKSVGGE